MQVNIVNLRKEMTAGLDRSVYPKAQAIVRREFNKDKNQLIRSFEQAKPSQALDRVAKLSREKRGESQNDDGFVEKGNLYTFFGIDGDRNPVEEVKNILIDGVELKSLTKGGINAQGIYVITGKVEIPTLGEINSLSTLPWGARRGWIDALTNGLRGLPNFLFGIFDDDKYKSKSGGGLQAKNKRTGDPIKTGRGEFQPFEGNYLFEFLERFKRKIRGNK